jgi:transcriptional regulator with XRE-family HTH domain
MDYTDLIRQARDRKGLSQQAAATEAGITVQHWGQIERGKERGKDETVAKMALVVGVTAEQLENAGRDLAADQLRELRAEADGQDPDSETFDDVLMLQGILRKLTLSELRWIIDHADVLAGLSQPANRRTA